MNCEHAYPEIRALKLASGAIQYVEQCMHCGAKLSQPIAKAVAQQLCIADPEPFDTKLADQWRLAKDRARAAESEDKSRQWWGWYNEYLRSPEWQHKRALVLKRAHAMCEGCAQRKATQVHHLTYANVGDELLFQVVALCDQCHEKLHDKNNKRGFNQ